MSLSRETEYWMNRRDELTEVERSDIEFVFSALYRQVPDGDKCDGAAKVEAALIEFIIAARK